MAFLSKQTKAKQFFSPHQTTMPPHEHDRPDPNLIIQGVHHIQPFGGLQKLQAGYLDGQINVDSEIMKKYIGDFDFDEDKGVPAWESCTGTWLVSPAAGCEKKKMEVSTTGPQTTKLSTIEHILVYTNSIASGLASRGL